MFATVRTRGHLVEFIVNIDFDVNECMFLYVNNLKEKFYVQFCMFRTVTFKELMENRLKKKYGKPFQKRQVAFYPFSILV